MVRYDALDLKRGIFRQLRNKQPEQARPAAKAAPARRAARLRYEMAAAQL
jgi:hypothetical protein